MYISKYCSQLFLSELACIYSSSINPEMKEEKISIFYILHWLVVLHCPLSTLVQNIKFVLISM